MMTITTPFPVSNIEDPGKIRLLAYANNQYVHVPLSAITGPLEERIKALEESLSEKR